MKRKQVGSNDQEEDKDRTTSSSSSSFQVEEFGQTCAGDQKPQPSLGEVSATDENGDDDGFKTPPPTYSSDRTGPPAVAIECPPAPRKRRPVWCRACRKRKASSGDHQSSSDDGVLRRDSEQLDLSLEVEALFPPAILADFRRKIKKARQEN